MSITTANIRKRWAELVKIRRQKLVVQNVDEHYERDVGDLIRMNEALMKTCCQLNIKLNQVQGLEVKDFKFYWDNFDVAVERLLTRELIQKADG